MALELYSKQELVSSYKKYRPKYPDDVARYVINYISKTRSSDKTMDLMVEVGCGSGQATDIFAPYFKKVIATDLSVAQINKAVESNAFDHIAYKVGSAEDIKLENGTVDMVLSAQSVQFFDLPKFFDEAKRVLKPGGCIAIVGYFNKSMALIGNDHSAAIDMSSLIYDHLKPITTERNVERMNVVRNKYESIFEAIPWDDKQRCNDFVMSCEWGLEDIVGFEDSMAWYHDYMRQHDGRFENERLKDKVMRMFQIEDEKARFTVKFDAFVLVCSV